MKTGRLKYPDTGTPQGGVISPILANIYLHEVLDEWFASQVVPRLVGRATLVRFADDLVIIFEYERDARRVFDVLPKRLAKYGLTLHPEKTRLVDFRRPDRRALRVAQQRRCALSARHLRPAGLHPLLGHVPQGILGGEAEDRRRPLPARSQAHRGLVSPIPARTSSRAVGSTQAEAVGALRVFCRHRQPESTLQSFATGSVACGASG